MSDTQREALTSILKEYGFSESWANAYPAQCGEAFAMELLAKGWQAALAQMPRISEKELAKMIVESANLGEKPENHVGLALGYKVARAILAKFPQIKEGNMQPITTTLKAIRQHRPCGLEHGSTNGYQKLVKFLGKDYGDETPIRFSQIVESNGVEDAYWCLRALPEEHDNEVRLLLADVAERVLAIYEAAYPDEKAPRQTIEAARAYARGEISKKELAAAWYAAEAAAWTAAKAAASTAAWDAAWGAAWYAAEAAASTAAWDAAWGAARDAAWDSAMVATEAATRAAARAATRAAARAATRAAARNAAWDAERKAQAELLIKRFG